MRSTQPTLDHFDRHDTLVLKGVAIVGIVLHNFFHLVSPARQNEFHFHPGGFDVFLHEFSQPSHAVQALFSFFGHFGVQIFIFLSAFGLAMGHWDDDSWPRFMWGRIKKLYPTFLLIVIPWLCAIRFVIGPHRLLEDVAPQVVAMLLGISPLIGYGLPPVGPWWFIPFIMQFYAMWFGLRWIAKRFGWPGLLLIAATCVMITQVANPLLDRWSVNLLMTPIGRMPVICFGIAAARFPLRITAVLSAAGLATLIAGSIYAPAFLFTFLGMLLASLWVYMQLRDVLRGSGLLIWIGERSMLIFLLNAIVRNELVGKPSTPAAQLPWGLLSAALSIAIADVIARLLQPGRNTGRIVHSGGSIPENA